MRVSVVIPVFNSEQTLEDLVGRLCTVLESRTEAFEILFVDDGSSDGSARVLDGLRPKYSAVRVLHLARNFGQHNALLCGIRAARHEIIVTMDDDLQHPPEEIPRLLAKLEEGWDVVYGAPEAEQHGLARDLASRIIKLALASAMGVENARNVSAFRAFRSWLREGSRDYDSPYVSIDVLLSWATNRFTFVRVRHEPRKGGTSGYTFGKLVRHAFNMMTGFSSLPLQVASLLGFAFTGFGVIVLIYVVARFLIEGQVIPGFAFLASIIAIFSGVQLFTVGIIGEYLARMHFRVMGRPAYLVRSSTDGKRIEAEKEFE